MYLLHIRLDLFRTQIQFNLVSIGIYIKPKRGGVAPHFDGHPLNIFSCGAAGGWHPGCKVQTPPPFINCREPRHTLNIFLKAENG
jgi:hypothetical protein